MFLVSTRLRVLGFSLCPFVVTTKKFYFLISFILGDINSKPTSFTVHLFIFFFFQLNKTIWESKGWGGTDSTLLKGKGPESTPARLPHGN